MALGQHVLRFSPDGKLFALINDQGILRIWDTETNELKQEYTPNLHLSGPCTALVWILASFATGGSSTATPIPDKKSKKSRKHSTGTAEAPAPLSLYIALGTSSGKVWLYSYAQGKIERTLRGEGHNGRVTSIAADDAGKLYSCGEDCHVVVWSLPEERRVASWSVGPEKPHSIAYLPGSKSLIVGGRQLRMFSLDSHELLQTFTGHTADIHLMSSIVLNDNEYALSSSRMERVICLWRIGSSNKSKLNRPAACTLLMEDIAYSMDSKVDSEGNLRVVGVTRSGVIHLYIIAAEGIRAEKPIKPQVTLSVASDSATVVEPIPAIGASLHHSYRKSEVLIGYGDKRFMSFEHVKPVFVEKMQVLVRTVPRKLHTTKSGQKDAAAGDAAALLKTITPIIKSSDVAYKSSLTVPKKKLKTVEMPMESRLQNLHLVGAGENASIQAQSKVRLLVQALHSKDATLLRSVLLTKDPKTIQLTLQKLPVQYVGVLVNELTLLMQETRMNVEFSIKWLKALALTHAGQLMALGPDDLLNKFGPCLGIIEHRSNCLKEVSKLNGRLQLLVNHINRNAEIDPKSDDFVIYEDYDRDSNDSDLELVEGGKSAADKEWQETDESGDNDEKTIQNEQDSEDNEDTVQNFSKIKTKKTVKMET